jgi:hypothetical protein
VSRTTSDEKIITIRLPLDLVDFFVAEGKKYGIYKLGTYIRTVLSQYRRNREEADGKRAGE